MGKLIAFFVAFIFSTAALAQQAPSTVTNMPFASTPLSGSETLYVVQNGNPRKTTVGSLPFPAINNIFTTPQTITAPWIFTATPAFNTGVTISPPLPIVSGGSGTTDLAGIKFADSYNTAHNGTSNDIDPLTNALNACSAAGGGTVVLGPYRYAIFPSGTNTNLVIPTKCTLAAPSQLVGNYVGINYATTPYTLVVSPSSQIVMNTQSNLKGIVEISSAITNLSPTTIQQALTLQGQFAGTGITSATDVTLEDVTILGFAVGLNSSHGARTTVQRMNIDATQCYKIDQSHDVSRLYRAQCFPFLSTAAQREDDTITGAANNGSGMYRVTLASSSNNIATGNLVYVHGVVGAPSVNGVWIGTKVDATHVDLQGSDANGTTSVGSITSGFQVLNLASVAGIGFGTNVTGPGVPGGSTVIAVWPSNSSVVISAPATATEASQTFTFSDPAYSSGGVATLDATRRFGDGFVFTNSEGVDLYDGFAFGHTTNWHVSTNAGWVDCYGCNSDGFASSTGDPTTTGLVVDGGAYSTLFSGGYLGGAVVSLRMNSHSPYATHIDNVQFSGSPALGHLIEYQIGRIEFTGTSAYSTNPSTNILVNDASDGWISGANNDINALPYFESSVGQGVYSFIGGTSAAGAFTGSLSQAGQVTLGNGGGCVGVVQCGVTLNGLLAASTNPVQVMTNNGSYAMSSRTNNSMLTASGTIANFTLDLGGTYASGHEANVFFAQGVTALAVAATGASVAVAPTTITAGSWLRCVVDSTVTSWYCGGATGNTPTTATLAATTPSTGAVLAKYGSFAPGDGGAATYIGSSSACSLHSGAGDGGAQVAGPSGCWLLQSQFQADIRTWPVVNNNTCTSSSGTDDAPAIRDALVWSTTTGAKLVWPGRVTYTVCSKDPTGVPGVLVAGSAPATTTTAAQSKFDTTLTVASTAGITTNTQIAVLETNGAVEAEIVTAVSGSTLTIAALSAPVASGANVWIYGATPAQSWAVEGPMSIGSPYLACGLTMPQIKLGAGMNIPIIFDHPDTESPSLTNICFSGAKSLQTGFAGGPDSGSLYVIQMNDAAAGINENSMVFRNVVVTNGYNGAIYQGFNRGHVNAYDINLLFNGQTSADHTYFEAGYDSMFVNPEIGSGPGVGMLFKGGAQLSVFGGGIFQSYHAVEVNGGAVAQLTVVGTQMNGNICGAIYEDSTGVTPSTNRVGGHVFSNIMFDSNSTQGNGQCPDVQAGQGSWLTLVAPMFAGGSSSSTPNYNIATGTATVNVVAPTFGTTGAGAATVAWTDQPSQISCANCLSAAGVSLSQLQGVSTRLNTFTVGTLPTCNTAASGTVAYVSDALTPAYNVVLTGGSTTKTLAMCNGTTWVAH